MEQSIQPGDKIKDTCIYCYKEGEKVIYNVFHFMVANKKKSFIVVQCTMCGSFYLREVAYG